MLLQEPKAPQALAKLKYLLLGGEALSAALVNQIKISGRIINMYGPTETTVWSTSCPVDSQRDGATIPIGRPIANTEIYILDDQLQPVPRGVPGEILIGGAGVARGYLNRPELTAQRFVPNPFSALAGARLYRTGDLARYLPDGRIEFLGRLDHQVKLRGFRIELGEIETALRERQEIRECVVVLREISPDDKRLVAYLVAAGTPKSMELRRYLQARLPDYMVPSIFVTLEKLPLTPNGKIDRKALPAAEIALAETPIVPPQTELEKAIAGLWRELLHVEQVGLNDNFFDLGGHSLLMVQVQSRLSDLFSVNLPVLTLFQYPTISALAKHLAAQDKTVLPQVHDRARRQRAMFASRKPVLQEDPK
jgi:acyl-CoA synthetase (AMP-forming)/AMP-acid ligase II/acyl carrier protein